jgi:hypothetical protein
MRSQTVFSVLSVLASLACSHRSGRAQATGPSGLRQCAPLGTVVDTAYAVRAASEALQARDSLGPFKPAKVTALDEGFVISLVVAREPPPAGGGGLVWVDTETGCPVLLRLYE